MSRIYAFPGGPLALCPVPPDTTPDADSLAFAALPGLIHVFDPADLRRASSADDWTARDGAQGGAHGYRGFAANAGAAVAPSALFAGETTLTFPTGAGNIRFDAGTVTESWTAIIAASRSTALVALGDLFGVASSNLSSSQKGIYRWVPTGDGRMVFLDNAPVEPSNGNALLGEPAANRADIYQISYDAVTRTSCQRINLGAVLEYVHTDAAPVITPADRWTIGGGAPTASQSWRGEIARSAICGLDLFDGGPMQAALDLFVAGRIAALGIS